MSISTAAGYGIGPSAFGGDTYAFLGTVARDTGDGFWAAPTGIDARRPCNARYFVGMTGYARLTTTIGICS